MAILGVVFCLVSLFLGGLNNVSTLLHVSAFTGSIKPPKKTFLPSRAQRTSVFLAAAENKDDKETTTTTTTTTVTTSGGGFFMDECQPEEGEFCVTDEKTGKLIRLTLEEKERIFLDSLQAYYTSGRKVLSDSEFDLLKEDLQWNGSDMVVMNRKEAQYLAAMQEYLKGTPTMSDQEFDTLKKELMEEGSKFAVQTEPKCFIDTGICKVTLQEDKFRSNLLYLPATGLLTLLWLGPIYEIDALVAFRINPAIFLVLGSPLLYYGSKFVTEQLLFPKKFIAYGPCPSCSFENRVYFGDILGVEGFSDQAQSKCPNCKEMFTTQRDTLRASTIPKS